MDIIGQLENLFSSSDEYVVSFDLTKEFFKTEKNLENPKKSFKEPAKSTFITQDFEIRKVGTGPIPPSKTEQSGLKFSTKLVKAEESFYKKLKII